MTNGTLEELDLAFNTVQAAGAEHLANVSILRIYSIEINTLLQAILINSTLSALSVRQNNIGMLGEVISIIRHYNKLIVKFRW